MIGEVVIGSEHGFILFVVVLMERVFEERVDLGECLVVFWIFGVNRWGIEGVRFIECCGMCIVQVIGD